VAQAQAELRRLLARREDNSLPVLRQTPRFADYAREYLAFYQVVKDAKRPRTLETEGGRLKLRIAHLGETRLDRITKPMITAFVEKRQADGKSGRTVNLGVTVSRNVLKKAVGDGWLARLPTENLRPLKWIPKKRPLFSPKAIQDLCAARIKESKNGQEFSDYIKLMSKTDRLAASIKLRVGVPIAGNSSMES